MKSEHLSADEPQTVDRAAALLLDGKLVVFPTDTVYGLGAHAFKERAIVALFQVKGRSLEKGIPILLADAADLDKVAQNVPPVAEELMARFWPGPLTLIVPRHSRLPDNLSPDENIAVRVPDNRIARAIIAAAGGAVATSSANRSGEAPAREAQEALRTLSGLVAAVVDGGPAAHGKPSTIVDCTTAPPEILRVGALDPAALSLEEA